MAVSHPWTCMLVGLSCFSVSLAARAEQSLDLALVLAVDVSSSMTLAEQELQRAGYVQAFQSPLVHKAVQKGVHGRIAVTYVEWAGANDQAVLIPWFVMGRAQDAKAFAAHLAQQPIRQGHMTSISGAIHRSLKLLDELDLEPVRRVIDLSGDGPNNDGPKVWQARDQALAEGVTVNALPIMLKSQKSPWDIPDLDGYYRDCVVGGRGAFVLALHDPSQFADIIRAKVLREIAGTGGGGSLFVPAEAGADCLIGEKRRREEEAFGGEGSP